VLHEGTNAIDIFNINKSLCQGFGSGYAVEGILNPSGITGSAVPGRNYGYLWTASNDGRRFAPDSVFNYHLSAIPCNPYFISSDTEMAWLDLSNNQFSFGQQLTVHPLQTTQYILSTGSCPMVLDTVTIHVSIPATPPPGISPSGPVILCEGQSVALTSFNPNGNLWSTGDTAATIVIQTTGSYYVSAYDSACGEIPSDPVQVTVIPPPQASFTYSVTVNGIQFHNSSTGAFNYHWSFGDGTQSVFIDPLHFYADSLPGHVVELIAFNSACSDTFYLQVYAVGVPAANESPAVMFYPNPAQNQIRFDFAFPPDQGTLTVMNLAGQLEYQAVISGVSNRLDLSSWCNGMYIFTVKDAVRVQTGKFIKE